VACSRKRTGYEVILHARVILKIALPEPRSMYLYMVYAFFSL